VAGGRHTRTRDRGADLILKRLAGFIAFPTSRSNANSRIAWATNFCGLMDSTGIPHRKAVSVCSRRPWASSHAGLFGGAQEQLASAWQYRPCGQIIDATLVLTPKQHFTKEEKDIVEQGRHASDRSPTKRRQKDLDASWWTSATTLFADLRQ